MIYNNGENSQTKIKKNFRRVFSAEKFMLRPEHQNKHLNISQHLVINNRAEYEKISDEMLHI